MKKIILIGAINKGKVATCGETIKNQLLLQRLEKLYDKVIAIDTINWQKRPWVLLQLLFHITFNYGAKVIISASRSASYLISFFYYVPLKKNIFYWVIGGNLPILIKNGLFKIKALKKLKWIIVEGNSMMRELEQFGIRNTICVPNFKSITYNAQILPERFNDKIKRFVFLSRIHPQKGVLEILEAAKQLNKEGFNDKFIIDFYGTIEPNFKDEFESEISKLENVNYNGFLNLRDNSGYETLSTYQCMLFPTYWYGEGFPGVVIDAYIAGLPIIASDWNMNKEIVVPNVTGFIVPPKDSFALHNLIKKIITHEIDLSEFSYNCIKKADSYNYNNIITEELLSKLNLK